MNRLIAPLLLTAFLAASPAHSASVYSQGANPNTFSRSDVEFGRIMTDDFVLGATTNVLSVSWQGAYWNDGVAPASDDFTIRFFADGGGVPTGAPIATYTVGNNVNRQAAGFSFPAGFTFPVYDYSANLPAGIVFTAGTTVWLSIENDAPGSKQWGWGTIFPDSSSILNPAYRSSDGGVTWPESWTNNTLTFSLNDTPAVPEPVAPGLIALGALTGLLRRKRAAASRCSSSR
ncbi:MAG: hypothetical protein AAGB14_15990 [Verrucomicrobiota bacterium]